MSDSIEPSSRHQRFQTTQWSMVVAAGDAEAADNSALANLCQKYWFPLYAFVRQSGYQSSDAQDLTQAFFERIIEQRFIDAANPERGKFRTFLLASLKNFLANEWAKGNRQKRGGNTPLLSLDFHDAEGRFNQQPAEAVTPEQNFEQQWALEILKSVLLQLRESYRQAGNEKTFEALETYLTADSQRVPYQQTAERHGMTAGQVKINVHRMRARYREMLEAEIGQTVDSTSAIEDEIRCLFSAVSATKRV